MLTAEQLHLVQYFCTEYRNSLRNIINYNSVIQILYLADIWECDLVKPFWK
jgi:hypothetical protein